MNVLEAIEQVQKCSPITATIQGQLILLGLPRGRCECWIMPSDSDIESNSSRIAITRKSTIKLLSNSFPLRCGSSVWLYDKTEINGTLRKGPDDLHVVMDDISSILVFKNWKSIQATYVLQFGEKTDLAPERSVCISEVLREPVRYQGQVCCVDGIIVARSADLVVAEDLNEAASDFLTISCPKVFRAFLRFVPADVQLRTLARGCISGFINADSTSKGIAMVNVNWLHLEHRGYQLTLRF